MNQPPSIIPARGPPFVVKGPYIGSLFTTALGVPGIVKGALRLSGMANPFCLACGQRAHRMEGCSLFTSCAERELIAALGAEYSAHLLAEELNLFPSSRSDGYLGYAHERWGGGRVTFQSFLAFARTGHLLHPADSRLPAAHLESQQQDLSTSNEQQAWRTSAVATEKWQL